MRRSLALLATAALLVLAGCGGEDEAGDPAPSTEVPNLPDLPKAKDVPGPSPRFFFYFKAEDEARTAEGALTEAGYEVQVTPPDAVIAKWSVIATGTPDALDLAAAEDDGFIPLAEELGGEYDGNEIPLG